MKLYMTEASGNSYKIRALCSILNVPYERIVIDWDNKEHKKPAFLKLNPRGQVPKFDEVFPDEGDIDMVAAVQAFNQVGFDGVIRIDHCPGVVGDNGRADRSFAFQVGYLIGLVNALRDLGGK